MTTKSSIEWTEHTWNPVVGCTKISAGCKNCYAETMARRLKAMGVDDYRNGFKVTPLPHRLEEPLARKKSTVYFVNSMSDLFHPSISDRYIRRTFKTIEKAGQHTFQVLTKRADRLAVFFSDTAAPSNAWLGVSVENRRHGVPRIAQLRAAKASVRFLSIEPLLEDLGELDLTGIDWVIVGGESGPKARPMKLAWVNSIRKQCEAAGVAFFFKQWGTWGVDGVKRSKHSNGRELLGRTWDARPPIRHEIARPAPATHPQRRLRM